MLIAQYTIEGTSAYPNKVIMIWDWFPASLHDLDTCPPPCWLWATGPPNSCYFSDLIINTLWFHINRMFRIGSWWGVLRQYQYLWHEVCIRMLMSSSLPPWISCTDISYIRQVKNCVKTVKNWHFSAGIVPSSCSCIVVTIFTGKLQSDVVCQVLQKYIIHVANCYRNITL